MQRPSDALEIRDLHPPAGDVKAEVLAGLRADPPSLPCKLFYDEAGSRLFDRITELPEYYQTRTETRLLADHVDELATILGRGVTLVEYGSGSSVKTRLLLEHLDVVAYVPIDISRWYLETAARRLGEQFPGLAIRPVVTDYNQPVHLAECDEADCHCVGFFPGSTIGNFDRQEARAFLECVARTLGPRGRLLLGVDLKKDPRILHAAYNDSAGVTARFNLNLLRRLNKELGANFDLGAWHHYAPYNPVAGRIEMYLVSRTAQTVTVAGESFSFERGDAILTERSYKYTPGGFARLAHEAGFDVERAWTDPAELFSVELLRVRA